MKKYFLAVITTLLMVSGHCFSQYILYPPQNLTYFMIEVTVVLKWHKPQTPIGTIPPGLIGYTIYRNGDSVHYNSLPDDTTFYDYSPDAGYNQYYVTAWYDLTSYGYPGQFGESGPSDSITVFIDLCCFPFFEPWDMGSWTFNIWTFSPAQGNWAINLQTGNPLPSAVFTGLPAEISYSNLLISKGLPGYFVHNCSDLWIEFDYKLENDTATGTEKLEVELYFDHAWHTVWETTNQASVDWTHVKFFINQVRVMSFRVGFRASGLNSANINRWLIDNILVNFICRPPLNISATNPQANQVIVSWNKPVCDDSTTAQSQMAGYNVYRTDSTGLPPFSKINSSLVQDTFYIDWAPALFFPGQFAYFVTAAYLDSLQIFLCESASDTVYLILTGTGNKSPARWLVYPNPSQGQFRINLPAEAVRLEISDMNGISILTRDLSSTNSKEIQLDLAYLPKGIYPLKLILKSGIIRDKLVLY